MTRDEPADGPLCTSLRASGLTPLLRPVLRTEPLVDERAVSGLRLEADQSDWLLVTSPRTVEILERHGFFRDGPPAGLRLGAAGPSTAEALENVGWRVHVVPGTSGAGPLLAALTKELPRPAGQVKVLLPASRRARPELTDGLTALGCQVRLEHVYDVVVNEDQASWWETLGSDGSLTLALCSPSAVEGVDQLVPPDHAPDVKDQILVGAQGPTTAEAARDTGWRHIVEASPRTFQGLADVLAESLDIKPSQVAS